MSKTVDVRGALIDLKHLTKQLTGPQLNRAISQGINKTLTKGRTEARRVVKDAYNIPQRNVAGIDINRAKPSRLYGYVFAPTKPIPLNAFKPVFQTPTRTIRTTKRGEQRVKVRNRKNNKTGAGTTVEIRRGQKVNLPYAFMIPGAKPHVFARGAYKGPGPYHFIQRKKRERSEGSDIHINPLMSVTTFQTVVNIRSIAKIKDRVVREYPKEIEHSLRYNIQKASAAATSAKI